MEPTFDEKISAEEELAITWPNQEEADEDDVAELTWWESLLVPLGYAPADSPAARVAAAAAGADAPSGRVTNPLAHAHWADLPLGERLAILHALVEARISMPLFTGGVDDVAAFVHSAGKEPSEPDYGLLGPPAATSLDAARLRWRALGSDGKTRFFTFPVGSVFEREPRIFSERFLRLRGGRRVRVWTTVATDFASLVALRDAALTAVRTKTPVPLSALVSNVVAPWAMSAPDTTLVASLKSLILSCDLGASSSGRRAVADVVEEDGGGDGGGAGSVAPRFVPLALTRAPRLAASVAIVISAESRGPTNRS